MRISKSQLKKVIKEELNAVWNEKKAIKSVRVKQVSKDARERAKMLSARKRSMMGGELMSIANGIVEEEEELDEASPWHDEDGRFSSERDAKCSSTYFKDGHRKRLGGSLSDKDDTGRGKHPKGQGRRKCKSDELKWESLVEPSGNDDDGEWMTIRKGALERLIAEELGGMLDVFLKTKTNDNGLPTANETSIPSKMQDQCKRYGLRSLKDCLNLQNNFEKASKGNLHKKGKGGG